MNALFWCVVALIVLACIYAIAHDDTTPRRTRTPPRHSAHGLDSFYVPPPVIRRDDGPPQDFDDGPPIPNRRPDQ